MADAVLRPGAAQKEETIVQPGSLESEAAIFACGFDQTGGLPESTPDKRVRNPRTNPNDCSAAAKPGAERWWREGREGTCTQRKVSAEQDSVTGTSTSNYHRVLFKSANEMRHLKA